MNCPFCGAQANDGVPMGARAFFACGTMLWEGSHDRSDQSAPCVITETNALKARITELKKAGNEALILAACGRWRDAETTWKAVREAKP